MASSDGIERHVVIKVIRADIAKAIKRLQGKMDPYVTVSLVQDGKTTQLSRTFTDWDSHKSPSWDYLCRGFVASGAQEVLIGLYEDDSVRSDLIGTATVRTSDLNGDEDGGIWGEVLMIPLISKKGKEGVGSVYLQAISLDMNAVKADTNEENLTRADQSLFHVPVKRLGVSGGTAPFFQLSLKDDTNQGDVSSSHWIGKDLSRATDEVKFYEEALELSHPSSNKSLDSILKFTFEYAGILTAPEEGLAPEDESVMELLVLRNLRDKKAKLRLMDLKIGQKTAQAGWQGKSRLRAMKQSIVDGSTNSSAEGYRLEGFDGKPATVSSMDPFIDVGESKNRTEKTVKKAERVMYQNMPGMEIFMHYCDLHMEGLSLSERSDNDGTISKQYDCVEYSELVMHETVRKLNKLAIACNKLPVPQKWIGSSVALGFDCGALPFRSTPESEIRDSVLVHVFDWGRSVLNTVEKMENLTEKEQRDRNEFWGYYKFGIENISWAAARTYFHRFGNFTSWDKIKITLFDFDSLTSNDYMGDITIPLEPTLTDKTQPIFDSAKNKAQGELTYNLTWHSAPKSSRLKGFWRIYIIKGTNLPAKDKSRGSKTSDPFCTLTTFSDAGRSYQQVTSVKPKTLNPVWKEYIYFPIAKDFSTLASAFEGVVSEIDLAQNGSLLLPPKHANNSGGDICRSLRRSLSVTSGKIQNTGIDRWIDCLKKSNI